MAQFIGSPSMNLFRMRRDGNLLRAIDDPESTLPLPPGGGVAEQTEVLAGVRPHEFRIASDTRSPGIHAVASLTEHLGRNNYLVSQPRAGANYLYEQQAIQAETSTRDIYPAGKDIILTAPPDTVRLFALDGQAIGR